MNKRDLQRFEKVLKAEQDRLTVGVQRLEKDTLYRPVSDNNPDLMSLAEVGTDNFERETALNLTTGEANRLHEVSEALKRIREGKFGVCEGCEGDIPKKRLEAFPSAKYCIECQSKLERDGVL